MKKLLYYFLACVVAVISLGFCAGDGSAGSLIEEVHKGIDQVSTTCLPTGMTHEQCSVALDDGTIDFGKILAVVHVYETCIPANFSVEHCKIYTTGYHIGLADGLKKREEI